MRRPEASVGGAIGLRKVAVQDADSLVSRRKATRQPRYSQVAVRSCVVEEPSHAEKQHVREPGDLQRAFAS